ncbi:HD domain-containing phosphohydrolase [Antrihabitans sp. YC2-6]|uniref:HD domain-containing phosphohydrolase n=1 Tax=Antrihabitans sp. YC2-6 TaxID=2799498 RepID=UPI0018F45A85|nr:HD domain-containing phosphohydrolase [Antrihabitans sp. YC2-6]MBJ8343831.1 HD domain-containing protein [Antrihabitans sp. YC2-6]
MDPADKDSGISLAELLAAFSMATDLGLGQPMEHILRSWQIAARTAGHVGLPPEQQESLFYVAMLSWVGCVADAPEVGALFGDDIAFRSDGYAFDLAGASAFRFFAGHAAAGAPMSRRILAAAALVATGGRNVVRGMQSHCMTVSTMAQQLGLADPVAEGLRQFFTRWDGRGVPEGVGGTDIALPIRLFHLADVVEVHHRIGGVDDAVKVARDRRGTQFDPEIVDAFCAIAPDVLPDIESHSELRDLIADDPALRRQLSEQELDVALESVADFTDLRSLHRAGHSRGVADLAAAAATKMRMPVDRVREIRRAGLLHDIGLHGLPGTVLDKSGPLAATEWERVRLSAYYTERVLARPPALARIGAVAALAHERMDGSGYHRGMSGSAIPVSGRILAAACMFRALTENRAHRRARTAKEAATMVRDEVRAGRIDADAADAVLAAAGVGAKRRTGPSGLTPREVEVLQMIAHGASTVDVARNLGIAKKTAGTHIERIYTKTGSSSRSTATLFALRNGLLDPLDL